MRGPTIARRGRASALMLGLVSIIVAGCSTPGAATRVDTSPEASAEGSTSGARPELEGKIVFFHTWPAPDLAPYFDQVVADYIAANPKVEIEVQSADHQPYKDKIRVLTAANQLPDIYFTWPGDFTQKFVRAGLAADLTEAVQGSDWKDRLAPASVEAFTYDSKVYAIPATLDAKFFIYNKQTFADNGISVPENLDELLAVCDTLKATGIQPIAFGNRFGWPAIHYLTQLNGRFVAADTLQTDYAPATGAFTDPGYVQALETFAELNSRCLTPGSNGIEHGAAEAQLLNGKAAMLYGNIVSFANYTEEGGAPAEFAANWDFFPMPPVPGAAGDQESLAGAPDGFIVNAQSQNKDVAIDFLRFFSSRANGQRMVEDTGLLSPVTGSATAETTFPQLIRALETLNEASSLNIWLDTIVNIEVANAYLAGVEGMLGGTRTPDQVMQDVQAAAEKAKQAVSE